MDTDSTFNTNEIFSEIFPDIVDDSLKEYIIWEETGYPCFWDSSFGNNPKECFRNQLLKCKQKYYGEI